MPEAINYILDTKSDAWKQLEDSFAKEYNARAGEFAHRWKYYKGDHKKPLKIQSDDIDDNVIVNQIEQFAEDIVGFLIGDGIRFDASGDDVSTPQDDAIKQMWTASRGAILQQMLGLGGCIEGHCAVRLVPVEGAFPKLQRLQGKYFSVFWDALDMSRVLWYRLQYVAGDMGKRVDYVRGRVDGEAVNHDAPGWTEIIYTRRNEQQARAAGGEKWQQEINPVIWEFDFPPIVDWQNSPDPNDYYGQCDVKSAIKLNDGLNLDVSNAQRIVKHHADPKTIGTGFTTDQLVRTEVGGLFTISNPDARVYNLEMQSDGAFVQWLVNVITSQIWQSGGMIDPQQLKDQVGALTNFGLRVLFNRAIKKTQKKRLLYAEAFEQIAQRGLIIAGVTPPESVTTIWPDVLPEDDTQETQVLGQELNLGIIGKQTYRERRGYDNEKEEQRLQDDQLANPNIGAAILRGGNIEQLLRDNRPFNRGA